MLFHVTNKNNNKKEEERNIIELGNKNKNKNRKLDFEQIRPPPKAESLSDVHPDIGHGYFPNQYEIIERGKKIIET